MRLPRTLDELLRDARVFPHDDLADEEGEWHSRRALAQDYADAVRRGTAGAGFPQPALGPATFAFAGPGQPAPVSRRECAARDLRALSSWTIRGPRAAELIAGLATTHQIEPESALVFACLLHLADRDDQAEFFWQFAAGAGKAASAECLALLHTTRGEFRQARHWAQQAAVLDAPEDEGTDSSSTTASRREPRPLTSLMLLRLWRILRGDDSAASLTIGAFHACAGTLSRAMTATIQSLKAEPGSDFGLLSWPDLALADQLQEGIAT